MRWIDLANVEKDFEGLKDLIAKQQYLESCPVQLAIFLRESKPKDLYELAQIAEQYMDAHNSRSGRNSLERNKRPMTESAELFKKKVGRNANVRPYFGERCNNCSQSLISGKYVSIVVKEVTWLGIVSELREQQL